jgi:uncharacterized membrane protein YfcA
VDPFILFLAFLATVFGGFVKGSLGFGFPLIVTPLAAALLDPQTAVVSISVPALISNVLILARGGLTRAYFLRVLPALALIVLGTVLGANLLKYISPNVASFLVGLVATLYAATALAKYELEISARLERVTMPVVGLFGGLLGGATNISGPVFGMYLHGLKFQKTAYVYTIALLFMVGNTTQVLSYSQLGLFTEERVYWAIASCIPMAIGLLLGFYLHNRLNQAFFSRLVLVLLCVTGVSLMWRAVFP